MTQTKARLRGDSEVDPSDEERGEKVRQMFADIAPKYDFANRVISGGRDQAWRRQTLRMAGLRATDTLLDVCSGTGDLALMAMGWRVKPARVIATDFTHEMLAIAGKKAASPLPLLRADALDLPLADASVDVVTVGYGVRNFQDRQAGLRELIRVLKPDGRLAILECTPPRGLVGACSNFYIRRVVPMLGQMLTGSSKRAYSYLSDSIQLFPDCPTFKSELESLGLVDVRFKRMNFGTMAVHVGRKP